ncbi:Uncharacterised protein [Chlamydia trachomatis]|nr:Uncharacterised protein [Chlamydia trachomatis]
MLDLAPHVGVPGQGNQQQQAGADDDARDQLMIVSPVTVGRGGVAPPAAVDHAHFIRGNAEQGLVEDRAQLRGLARGGQGECCGGGADAGADLQAVLENLGRQEVVGDHQGVHGPIYLSLCEQLGCSECITGFHQVNLRKVLGQGCGQGVTLGYRQALSGHLLHVRRRSWLFARQQHIGVFEVRAAEIKLWVSLVAGNDGPDHIDFLGRDLVDHRVDVAPTLYRKTQAGAQADQFQQVRGDPAKVAVRIEKCQWREGFVDDDRHHRVVFEPTLFALGQLQFLVGQQDIAAGAPTLGDALPFIDGHRSQC